jgi:5'-deoxynucleotidase
MANERLLSMLPEGLRGAYAPYLTAPADYDRQVVKAADSISAYLKCLEEKRAGNREFDSAGASIKESLMQIELPEVQDFIREFIPSFELSLDELNQPRSL